MLKKIRCRGIVEDDFAAVSGLLCEGFKGRPQGYWLAGFERLRRREVPEGYQRYGLALEADGTIVGAILLIASTRNVDGEAAIYSNVAGWYIKPEFRSYAQMLVSTALRRKDTTYVNTSAAPHTWPIVENQGYTRYCAGLFFALAPLRPRVSGVRIQQVHAKGNPGDIEALASYGLLQRHAAWGNISLVCREGDRSWPFIFQPFRIRSGRIWTPVALTIHAPDRDELVRLAGNIGWHLLRHGVPVIAMDADARVPGLIGVYTDKRGRKYFKGPRQPRQCDLTDTEFAIFGI